jgi:hypothetical protein
VSLVQLNWICIQNECRFPYIMSMWKVTAIQAFGNKSLESWKMTSSRRG